MNKKLCICVSGGLDSFTAIMYAKTVFCPKHNIDFENEVILLSVRETSIDSKQLAIKEYNSLFNLAMAYGFVNNLKTVLIDGYENLVKPADSHVVLGRNAMLASIGAGIAETVWICGTAYEDNPGMYDKNSQFFYDMTKALTQACKYLGRNRTFIESPFQGRIYDNRNFGYSSMEKHDMIVWLESQGIKDWRLTTSCFHPTHKRCGDCVVCGKRFVYEKWVELQHGIKFDEIKELRETFVSDPLKNKYLLETFEKMKDKNNEGRYHSSRVLIYKTVLKYYEKARKNENV